MTGSTYLSTRVPQSYMAEESVKVSPKQDMNISNTTSAITEFAKDPNSSNMFEPFPLKFLQALDINI